MTYFLSALILVAWVVLIAIMVRAFVSSPSCPECGGERIESIDLRTSTITVEGETVPAAWMYRRCHSCGARLKWDIGQDQWVELEPGEWDEVVENADEVPRSES